MLPRRPPRPLATAPSSRSNRSIRRRSHAQWRLAARPTSGSSDGGRRLTTLNSCWGRIGREGTDVSADRAGEQPVVDLGGRRRDRVPRVRLLDERPPVRRSGGRRDPSSVRIAAMQRARSSGLPGSNMSPASVSASNSASPPVRATIERGAGGERLEGDDAERLVQRRDHHHAGAVGDGAELRRRARSRAGRRCRSTPSTSICDCRSGR